MKTNRKERQAVQIFNHGRNLIRLFNLPDGTDPLLLCKKLRRLEKQAHQLAEDHRNGLRGMDEADAGKLDNDFNKILYKVDGLLNFHKQGIPVFINRDPRGYALKIQEDWVYSHGANIYRDWGGYGRL